MTSNRNYHERQLWQCRAAMPTLRRYRHEYTDDEYTRMRDDELDSAHWHRAQIGGNA